MLMVVWRWYDDESRSDSGDVIASKASIFRLKWWDAQTNIPKQGGTFWQDELASLRIHLSGAGGPKVVCISLRIVPMNFPMPKKSDLLQ